MDEARLEKLPAFGAAERLVSGLLVHLAEAALTTLLPPEQLPRNLAAE